MNRDALPPAPSLFQKAQGPLYMALTSIFWSFGGLCIKLIPWEAMSIVGLRAFFAFLVFGIYRRSFRPVLTPGNILAAFCLAGSTTLFVMANKMTTAAAAILLQFTAPIFVVLLTVLIDKKKPRLSELLVVLLTFGGISLFFLDDGGGSQLVGNLLSVLCGVCFAGVFFCNRRPDINPLDSVLLGFILTALIGLPFVPFQVTADPTAWGAVCFLGIVQVGLAYVFFTKAIARTAALPACLLAALEPVLNPVWVFLGTGEAPGPLVLLGGAIIICSVVGFNILEIRREPAQIQALTNQKEDAHAID